MDLLTLNMATFHKSLFFVFSAVRRNDVVGVELEERSQQISRLKLAETSNEMQRTCGGLRVQSCRIHAASLAQYEQNWPFDDRNDFIIILLLVVHSV